MTKNFARFRKFLIYIFIALVLCYFWIAFSLSTIEIPTRRRKDARATPVVEFHKNLPPDCPSFHNVSTESMTVTWTALKGEPKYELYYRHILKVPLDFVKLYEGFAPSCHVDSLDSGSIYEFTVKATYQDGEVRTGCVREATTLKAQNLIANPSFEHLGTPPWNDLLYVYHHPHAYKWQPFSLGYFLAGEVPEFPAKARSGTHSIVMKIDPHPDYTWDNNGAFQHIFLNQTQATAFTLSGWSYADHVTGTAGSNYAVMMDMRFQDGSHLYDQSLIFDPKKESVWQHKCIIVQPIKPVHSVGILVVFRGPHSGTVYFDDLMLWPSTGIPKGTYDKKTRLSLCRRSTATASNYGNYREHPLFMTSEKQPGPNDVSVVTQLSVDRLERLVDMVHLYNGHVSAAIYIRDKEWDLNVLTRLRKTEKKIREFVDFHLLYDDHEEYPSNKLRNLALQHCRTTLGLILDADFVTSKDLGPYLKSLAPKLREPLTAYVVAAFETDNDTAPATKEDLRQSMKGGNIKAVHIDKTFHSHGPTDHLRWLYYDGFYEVDYDLFYEPYIIINTKEVPPFDERFRGYGHDKESHSYELDKAGYRFQVVPEAFVVHINHPESAWKPDTSWLRVEKNWYDFVVEMNVKYPHHPKRVTWLEKKLIEEGQLT